MVRSFVLVIMVTGCAGRFVAGGAVPIAAPVEGEPEPAPEGGYAPGEDRHWMQPDDYFISEQPWERNWIYVHLAKLRTPPGPSTKDQGMFFQLDNSQDVWTQHFWRSRVAQPGELALGQLVICFNDNAQRDVYRAPASKRAARTGAWFMGKITDVSDAYKRAVRVDVYSCSMDAVRVVGR